jgi:hypothetical protein
LIYSIIILYYKLLIIRLFYIDAEDELFTTGHFLYYVWTSCHSRTTGTLPRALPLVAFGHKFLVADAPWRAGIFSILFKWMPDSPPADFSRQLKILLTYRPYGTS